MWGSSSFGVVVSSHTNPHLSGVAKFNEQLARRFGIPCIGLGEKESASPGTVLLSLKLTNGNGREREQTLGLLRDFKRRGTRYDVFWHSFEGTALEFEVVEGCQRIFASNDEIAHTLEAVDKPVIQAWCPGLVEFNEVVRERQLNLFSFGMAHKIQVTHYRKLKDCLERHHDDYSLWMSTAFHEKANFGDFDVISAQMRELFGERVQFLGFLSDAAVNYFLDKSHFFISFFPKGVRANNTSVNAAMERGCVVLTNLDGHSPHWMGHGLNLLDVHQMGVDDFEPGRLSRIASEAKIKSRQCASWDGLLNLMNAEI